MSIKQSVFYLLALSNHCVLIQIVNLPGHPSASWLVDGPHKYQPIKYWNAKHCLSFRNLQLQMKSKHAWSQRLYGRMLIKWDWPLICASIYFKINQQTYFPNNGKLPIYRVSGQISFPPNFCSMLSSIESLEEVFPDIATNFRNHDRLCDTLQCYYYY